MTSTMLPLADREYISMGDAAADTLPPSKRQRSITKIAARQEASTMNAAAERAMPSQRQRLISKVRRHRKWCCSIAMFEAQGDQILEVLAMVTIGDECAGRRDVGTLTELPIPAGYDLLYPENEPAECNIEVKFFVPHAEKKTSLHTWPRGSFNDAFNYWCMKYNLRKGAFVFGGKQIRPVDSPGCVGVCNGDTVIYVEESKLTAESLKREEEFDSVDVESAMEVVIVGDSGHQDMRMGLKVSRATGMYWMPARQSVNLRMTVMGTHDSTLPAAFALHMSDIAVLIDRPLSESMRVYVDKIIVPHRHVFTGYDAVEFVYKGCLLKIGPTPAEMDMKHGDEIKVIPYNRVVGSTLGCGLHDFCYCLRLQLMQDDALQYPASAITDLGSR